MANNHHNYQQKDDTLDRWRNLTLFTQSASSQPQLQSIQKQQSQLQSAQPQYQSQPAQKQQQQNSQPGQRLQQPQQKQDKKKKKKCRGNRKLQRFRAKLRKRGFNNETITTLINEYNNTTNQNQNEVQSIIPDMDVALLVPVRDQVRSII